MKKKKLNGALITTIVLAALLLIALVAIMPRLPLSEEKQATMTEKAERLAKDAHAAFSHYRTAAIEYDQYVREYYFPWKNGKPFKLRRFHDIQAAYQALGQEATRFARELDDINRGEFRTRRNHLAEGAERLLDEMESSKDVLTEPYEETYEDRHQLEKTLRSFRDEGPGFPYLF